MTLDTEGVCFLSQGKAKEAENCFNQALQIRRAILAPDHPDIAISEVNLAITRGLLNESDKSAVAPSLEKLALRLGNEHPLYKNEQSLAALALPKPQ
jgi:Tfp pilus assembly protein PilF